MTEQLEQTRYAPYITFAREEWADLRDSVPLPLAESELEELRGINEDISLEEVAAIYLPLARLLDLYVGATEQLHGVTARFLDTPAPKVPYVIGIGGSVAVGKSTTARILQALLARWRSFDVDLVTTDGFLLPNAVLEERGLMDRKGFPESYDVRRLIRFAADLKSGRSPIRAPVYSHLRYDILPGEHQVIENPDVVILEGLNVLQSGEDSAVFISDFFDFSVYVDAAEADLRQWYVDRFLKLRETVFRDAESYFHRYADLSEDEAVRTANRIWDEINLPNLKQNIVPTRERADLILEKGAAHSVRRVRLRKL